MGSLVLRYGLVLAILFQGRAGVRESARHFSRACVADFRRTFLGRDRAIEGARRTASDVSILPSRAGREGIFAQPLLVGLVLRHEKRPARSHGGADGHAT